ncbi:MAG TPA: hypothetical protein VK892_10230 [Pyrinomonadaceae bacterium]|nr:hypothetical protein [Pyrinomonadaceae bacterium]
MFAESVANQVAEQPGLGIEAIEIILLIGAVVAIIARRLKIPYTVGLDAHWRFIRFPLCFRARAGELIPNIGT